MHAIERGNNPNKIKINTALYLVPSGPVNKRLRITYTLETSVFLDNRKAAAIEDESEAEIGYE